MRETSSPAAPALTVARSRYGFVMLSVATLIGCMILIATGYLQPVVMGIVQGLGEFLPISSSAHLLLVPWFFGWEGAAIGTLTFDVALHLGTLIAIVLYFWRDWVRLLLAAPGLFGWAARRVRKEPVALTEPQYLLISIIIATIPAAVIGLLLQDIIEVYLRSPLVTVGTLAGVGVLLYAADRWGKSEKSIEQLTLRDALLIGLAQACALVPGVSRSGATMTMGRLLSFNRETAARYSFLMSAPITLAAVIFKLDDMLTIPASEMANFAIGILISAAVGALAIHFLLSYIKRVGFGVFALYRIALALVIVIVYISRS